MGTRSSERYHTCINRGSLGYGTEAGKRGGLVRRRIIRSQHGRSVTGCQEARPRRDRGHPHGRLRTTIPQHQLVQEPLIVQEKKNSPGKSFTRFLAKKVSLLIDFSGPEKKRILLSP